MSAEVVQDVRLQPRPYKAQQSQARLKSHVLKRILPKSEGAAKVILVGWVEVRNPASYWKAGFPQAPTQPTSTFATSSIRRGYHPVDGLARCRHDGVATGRPGSCCSDRVPDDGDAGDTPQGAIIPL